MDHSNFLPKNPAQQCMVPLHHCTNWGGLSLNQLRQRVTFSEPGKLLFKSQKNETKKAWPSIIYTLEDKKLTWRGGVERWLPEQAVFCSQHSRTSPCCWKTGLQSGKGGKFEAVPVANILFLSAEGFRSRICKRLRSPGIDSEDTTNRVVVPARQTVNRFLSSSKGLQIPAQDY